MSATEYQPGDVRIPAPVLAPGHSYKSITDIVSRFDCQVFSSDSTDAEIIHGLAVQAIGAMREMKRPSFLYLKYYRYLEHVGVNEDYNQGYRDRAEHDRWLKVDPLAVQRAKLLQWYADHPEAVAWGPDGRAYAGGEAGQLYRFGLEGGVLEEVARVEGGFLLGLAHDADANTYVCDDRSACA